MAASDVRESANPAIAEIPTKLGTDPKTGLNPGQLQERLSKYGPNALPEEKKSALSAFLAYFWGPIPWMIEAAALMAVVVGDWGDLTIITLWPTCHGNSKRPSSSLSRRSWHTTSSGARIRMCQAKARWRFSILPRARDTFRWSALGSFCSTF
jgi:Cation transporter/ATPase, N-terminus